VRNSNDDKVPIQHLLSAFMFGIYLYNFGTGSQMLAAGGDVLDQLHEVFTVAGSGLGFQVRRELKLFAIKVSRNPAVIDAAQYFTCNRNLPTTAS